MASDAKVARSEEPTSNANPRDASWRLIVDGLKVAGVDFVASVPDSRLAGVERLGADDPDFEWVRVLNEGDGLAVCAGAWLTGKTPALVMENTGFLVGLHALQIACEKFGIPVLLVMSNRGEFGDGVWWLAPLGGRLPALLEAAGVRFAIVDDRAEIGPTIGKAVRTMQAIKYPVAVLLGEGALV